MVMNFLPELSTWLSFVWFSDLMRPCLDLSEAVSGTSLSFSTHYPAKELVDFRTEIALSAIGQIFFKNVQA